MSSSNRDAAPAIAQTPARRLFLGLDRGVGAFSGRFRSLSLGTRLTVVAAAAVAVAVAVASAALFLLLRSALLSNVDQALKESAASADLQRNLSLVFPPSPIGEQRGFAEIFTAAGVVVRSTNPGIHLGPSNRAIAVAGGLEGPYYYDTHLNGVHVRVYVTRRLGSGSLPPNLALLVARPLTDVDAVLERLSVVLLLVAAGGAGLGAGLGRMVAGTALGPVKRLTEATEEITATRDLARRIAEEGTDELGRLARSFNSMLSALEKSVRAQRQLVADASHELRTPLTSMRTNLELLAREPVMDEAERREVHSDILEQLDELTLMVGDLVELAREEEHTTATEAVRLDQLVARAVDRARRRTSRVRFQLSAAPALVVAAPERIERAVGNLLDNAAKWSPPGSVVNVDVRDGRIAVVDRGPGIAPEDQPYIFDRFYRAASARGMPGSGLGLAIVKQVADAHGGRVLVDSTPGRGTRIELSLQPLKDGDGLGNSLVGG
ncbi:MAG TPA: HAMP domain-containing sensor histidine kinase [Actinomycetota bacterium]|jgi:two-component system sensor histidine kinase MprB|nr:HAMP domain-containing sensor histidine kinase [Actinomycetota bacterium]